MGDIQGVLRRDGVRNYYSVSISGYHIAEAGANPITQLALTLSNGFTYVEYYLARGMKIDELRAQPVVLLLQRHGPRVHRARPRRAPDLGGLRCASATAPPPARRSSSITSRHPGRSLHAQEIDFNDIRTTLQALLALFDNCNSLHTNAYDEAITTPTEASVRTRDGDPDDHQPRVRALEVGQPAAGIARRRRSDRSRRGGGLSRVRQPDRARRRARGDGAAVPALEDPGRVDPLRTQEALRRAPDHRREHVLGRVRRRGAGARRADPIDRGGEAHPAREPARLSGRARRLGAPPRSSACAGSRSPTATSSPS